MRRAELLEAVFDKLLTEGALVQDQEGKPFSGVRQFHDIGGYRYEVGGYKNKVLIASPQSGDPALSLLAKRYEAEGFNTLLLSDSLRVKGGPYYSSPTARRRQRAVFGHTGQASRGGSGQGPQDSALGPQDSGE